MYGKAYQAENILRKKKRRPFAKEILKEVNDGDLFNALFSQNIKEVKQKVKQDITRSSRPRKNVSQRPTFATIPELPKRESIGSDDFLDPFDALLVDTRGHIEKNKEDVCESQSKSGVKTHEDEKENLPEGENCLVSDDKKKKVFFESGFQGSKKKISEKSESTQKRLPLKLKSGGKGSHASVKMKDKQIPYRNISILNLIDSSCDSDALEDEFKAKREEMKKKKEEQKVITQSKNSLQRLSECEEFSTHTCSGNDSYSICKQSSFPNNSNDRTGKIENFMSSTPAKRVSMIKQSRVNQMKHEQKEGYSGNEGGSQMCIPASHTPQELPCLLSPILSVTEQRIRKNSHGQQNESFSSLRLARFPSEKNESQMSVKYWKKMYRKHNPVPVAVEKITVQSYIHASYEDSGTDEDFIVDKYSAVNCRRASSDKLVKSSTDKKESVCLLQRSPDPFADSGDLHEHLQTSADCLDNSKTRLEEVSEQSCGSYEQEIKYCHSRERKVTLESNESDEENFLSDFTKDETNQSKNNCECKYVSCIEQESIGCTDCENSLKESSTHLQDLTNSPSIRNVCYRKKNTSVDSEPEGKGNAFIEVNDSKKSLKLEIADSRMNSSFSAIAKLDTSERIPECMDIASQNGSVSEKMSKLSLSESRSSYKAMKRKSLAQRRSHLVVPLAQNLGKAFGRISGFREVYFGTPSQRRCMNKNLPESLPIETSNSVLKYGDDDDDLDEEKKEVVTFKDVVLEHCGQTDVLAFDEAFSESDLEDCKKIGEGVYGEVFARVNSEQQPTVMKIMPIEGDCQINGESQKSFEEILPEIVISAQLSRLRENEDFSTPNFPELIDCWCVQGKYPPKLLKLWQEYDDEKTSENDSPEILPEDQIFVILELSNVGSALESFTFNSAEQSWSAFMQVTCTLAVAEASLEFEHRDLHWGNILIKRTTDKTITCKLYGEDQVVPTQGIQASVIDFTLSRITYDGCCIYNNLAEDPTLFEGEGDYQFDVYRMMRDKTENNWQVFEPYNNVLWLSYVLEKLIGEAYYRNEKTKIHKRGISKLKEMRSRILDFNSATEVALSFSTS